MNKVFLTCLCHTILLFLLCLPAQARVAVGLAGYEQKQLDAVAEKISQQAQTRIKLRSFDTEDAITSWLLRFQELDAAIVTTGFAASLPAGTLKELADVHLQDSGKTPLTLVVRRHLPNDRADNIRDIFLSYSDSKAGARTIQDLGFSGITLPGQTLSKPLTAAPEPSPLPAVKKPRPQATDAGEKQAAEPLPATAPGKAKPVPETTQKEPAEKPRVQPVKIEPKPVARQTGQQLAKAEISASEPGKITTTTEDASPAQATTEPATTEPAATSEAAAEAKTPPNRRVMVFAALALLLALTTKAMLFVLRWRKQRGEELEQNETPQLEASGPQQQPTPPAVEEEVAEADTLVIETGHLGPGKVPALLKHCADLPKPSVLKVDKGFCEKLIYFAGGQVAGASTHKSSELVSAARWEKIGHLLVKDGIITAEEHNQARGLLEKEPALRLGEALLKLRLIDLESLRRALSRQAKSTIFSLILFPEGRYQILAGDGALPPEESVSLEVNSVIREASQHQAEWTAIRQSLPNLNLSLNFHPEGRAKLERVNLSSQQEETLALVDGKRTINDLCIDSNMMDYEVYRLLYLMVKAKVLM